MSISENIKRITSEIRQAEKEFSRSPNSVSLLAVSKSQSLDKIKAAIAAGQRQFGENYLQEALVKINALRAHSLEWHFIGVIQTNKTRLISENFDWVQSVSRLEVASALNRYRPVELAPLSICIQINISEEKTKSGIDLTHLSEFAKAVNQFDRLRLRGLMTIPAYHKDFNAQQAIFGTLKEAQQELIKKGLPLDVLSLGMSHDFRAAIAAGSTMVRIGTGIFGPRENR
ncbi:YggS family pyridoxal phosphate-dependent enzyme [Coxiella endosymbiont of Ornithodoros maritimus]|uniref:YggS family pyridoxal phosphate-dependent enzyme n=1 Tax=Coxiella endosymbiont of Ornithodoros maritimus TaxID=1656172 RepID=UPI002264DC45|nr:YggS family pyridoxal phosphate-dependent enzyme [Coxiella endosymbiont of Ornithodoros maritimus]